MMRWALAVTLVAVATLANAAAPVVIPEASARYRLTLEREAIARFGLNAPVARIAAQIHAESSWDATAASAYAQGLSQFTPPTAQWLPSVCVDVGEPDPWDAMWSLRAITCYDAWLYGRVEGAATQCDRWAFTESGYNGGPGWVPRDRALAAASGADPNRWFGHVENYSRRSAAAMKENRKYVARILLWLEPAYIAAGWPGERACP